MRTESFYRKRILKLVLSVTLLLGAFVLSGNSFTRISQQHSATQTELISVSRKQKGILFSVFIARQYANITAFSQHTFKELLSAITNVLKTKIDANTEVVLSFNSLKVEYALAYIPRYALGDLVPQSKG
jgi:hypothetical protein